MMKLWPFARSRRLQNQRPPEPNANIYRGRAREGLALTGGGYANPLTGAGGFADKSEGGFFTPTRLHNRALLETLYGQSWAAREFIDIPVDDMLIRWRTFSGGDEDAVAAMADAESRHHVRSRLARAMKAGRLHGSACIVIATGDAPLVDPLDLDRPRREGLSSLIVFDRYDASVAQHDRTPFSQSHGELVGIKPRILILFGVDDSGEPDDVC